MGREWYWSRTFRRGGDKESVGCMTGLLHFFDFHQPHFSTHHHHHHHHQKFPNDCKQDSTRETHQTCLEEKWVGGCLDNSGVEAPRNSLELDADAEILSTEVDFKEDIPIGIQVQPRLSRGVDEDSTSETRSLQGSKTPNLVARLMGLDLLADQISSPLIQTRPCSSQSRSIQRRDRTLTVNDSGSRSLPGTPRISSARRSDVDPRFSLQLNKENIEICEFNCSPFSSRRTRGREGKHGDENKSPSSYAREIVKQMKERVSRRRFGMDITNAITTGSKNRDEGSSSKKAKSVSKSSEESISCSPRFRFLEAKIKRVENKDFISICNSPTPSSSSRSSPPFPPSITLKKDEKSKSKPVPKSISKCKKASCERFTQRPNQPPTTAHNALRMKCKTPLSNDLLLQIQRSSNTSQHTPKVVNPPLSSGTSQKLQKYELQQQPQPNPPLDDRDERAELRYVKAILQRIGIDRDTAISFARWFSPSHPINPTLFSDLEFSVQPPISGLLTRRCNRRLLFHLIDQLLRESLNPHLGLKPWLQKRRMNLLSVSWRQKTGEQLLQQLLLRLSCFPSAKCETLEDIDELVGPDLPEFNVARNGSLSEDVEETESVAFELERQIFDSVVEEAVHELISPDSVLCNRRGKISHVWHYYRLHRLC